jgi:dephospho-CoA kinase
MRIIGITGNAGGGKSLAAQYLQSKGIPVISTDAINASLLENCPSLIDSIESLSRTRVSNGNGHLDKNALRNLVFSSKQYRKQLEQLLHPVIMSNVALQLSLLPAHPYCVVEIPLLFEANLTGWVNRILLVTARPELLLARLCERNNIDVNSAELILQNQSQDNTKLGASDDIVINNSDLATLYDHLDRLHHQYT